MSAHFFPQPSYGFAVGAVKLHGGDLLGVIISAVFHGEVLRILSGVVNRETLAE
jgi:hypothetical protein